MSLLQCVCVQVLTEVVLCYDVSAYLTYRPTLYREHVLHILLVLKKIYSTVKTFSKSKHIVIIVPLFCHSLALSKDKTNIKTFGKNRIVRIYVQHSFLLPLSCIIDPH